MGALQVSERERILISYLFVNQSSSSIMILTFILLKTVLNQVVMLKNVFWKIVSNGNGNIKVAQKFKEKLYESFLDLTFEPLTS